MGRLSLGMSRDAAGSRTRNGDDFLDSTSFRNTASSFSLCPLSLFATCESSDLSFGTTTATSSSHFVPPPTFLSSCEASTMGPASPSAARADLATAPATAAAALSRGFSGASGASVAPRHVPVQDTAARHRRQHESFITLLFIGGTSTIPLFAFFFVSFLYRPLFPSWPREQPRSRDFPEPVLLLLVLMSKFCSHGCMS